MRRVHDPPTVSHSFFAEVNHTITPPAFQKLVDEYFVDLVGVLDLGTRFLALNVEVGWP